MSDRCLRDTSRGCNGSAAADLEALLDLCVDQVCGSWYVRGQSLHPRLRYAFETRDAAVAALLAAAREYHRARQSTVHPPEPVE
jgi:hypothetical protein